YMEQEKVLAERAGQGAGQANASIATVAWIGYEVPDLFSVGGLDKAIVGADFLEKSSLGIRSDRGGHQPFISVYAHSYG
ncbi:alpha/beta hydrolase, partial [Mucilaginibacter sp. 5C4]